MTKQGYLELLVENIHSTTIATIGADGHPQTRVIDMMLYDERGVYFLTAKGKAFYAQLMEQGYIALSATKDKIETMMDTIVKAFDKQLDALFGEEALDVSTDITVMENLLAREGLAGEQIGGRDDGIKLEL